MWLLVPATSSDLRCSLLAAQSLYKLNSSEEGADPTRSPSRKTQPSPIGSDVMSPHHVSNWVI